MAEDLRDSIFSTLNGRLFVAQVCVVEAGLVVGMAVARDKAAAVGCTVGHYLADGSMAVPDRPIMVIEGSAKSIAMAEDCVIGAIAKPSGVARAANQACRLAGPRVRVVSGAVKKLPQEIKMQIRQAVHAGGGSGRIAEGPFLYLDKNYVRMFGGVRQTLTGLAHMPGFTRIVQLRGELADIAEETRAALDLRAEILMVDTGRLEDLDLVAGLARAAGRRDGISIAFAGNISLDDIPRIAAHDVDILDVGRAVIDAPLADLKLDVVTVPAASRAC